MKRKHYSAIFCNLHSEPAIVDQVYQIRKKIFIDQHGWDLPHSSGREHDAFDTAFTVYCALYCGENMVATFRAIRTDYPYLSAWVFPSLATEQAYPKRKDIWEISRFGVLSTQGAGERISLLNYGLMFYFAQKVGAQSLVASADPAYERFLHGLGIHTNRYGPAQIIGHTRAGMPLQAVAGEIPIAEQRGARFSRLIQTLDNVEIADASYVLGPVRIPA